MHSPTLSYARLQSAEVLSGEQLKVYINKHVLNKHDAQILESLVTFNEAILKTNFFTCALLESSRTPLAARC